MYYPYDMTDEAQPMIEYLRANVAKPDHLPNPTVEDSTFRFQCDKCPMGLIPGASIVAPGSWHDFIGQVTVDWPIELKHSVEPFARAWDAMKDPQLAVDAVWG